MSVSSLSYRNLHCDYVRFILQESSLWLCLVYLTGIFTVTVSSSGIFIVTVTVYGLSYRNLYSDCTRDLWHQFETIFWRHSRCENVHYVGERRKCIQVSVWASPYIALQFSVTKQFTQQKCITVRYLVPAAAAAIRCMVSGVSVWGSLSRGVSGVEVQRPTILPCGQTDPCENITFPQLRCFAASLVIYCTSIHNLALRRKQLRLVAQWEKLSKSFKTVK